MLNLNKTTDATTTDATTTDATTDATTDTTTDATTDAGFVHPQADVSRAEYSGLSSYINSGRVLCIKTGVQKYGKRSDATFTPRMHGCIAAMRKAYGGAQFTLRGFDNAQLAIFINSGVLVNVRNGDTGADGTITDGDKPATAKLAKRFTADATRV